MAEENPFAKYAQQEENPFAKYAGGGPKGTGSDTIDAGNAVGTGFFRGLANLAGLPGDTAYNLRDLGKAGLGAAYQAATGRPAPDSLQLTPRENDVGSGQWIVNQMRKTRPTAALVDPVNPDYEGGYLQNTGGALAGIANPGTRGELAGQVINNTMSANLGKAVGDATGSPELAIAASFTPAAARMGAADLTKRAIRGGEDGRRAMEQRIQDLKNSGVDNPTMGLASGNQLVGGVENLLQSTPGAIGIMRRAREDALAGLQGTSERAATTAGGANRGSIEAGRAVQSGIQQFRDDFKTQQGQLYDRMDRYIPSQTPVNVARTKGALAEVNADIPGAPELSKQFKVARLQAIEQAMQSDTAGAPQSLMVYSRPPVGGGGIMNAPVERAPILVQTPEFPNRQTLPFEAVKKTRTLVGNEIADTNLASSIPRSKWNPIYGALSEDLRGAAQAAGPQAEQAFNRANAFTRAGMDRVERVQPFADAASPEQAFQMLNRTLGDNATTLQAVKKTLPEGARGQVAGTVIDRLGRATPGQQNEMGTNWSPETFLTNWNRMAPKARDELLSGFPNADKVKADIEAVAKTTSRMRDSSKMWANPSGTGANTAARALMGAAGLGGVTGVLSPTMLAGGAAGMTMANGAARMLTNPGMVNAAASRTTIDPHTLDAQLRGMIGSGLMTVKDPEYGGLFSGR